jgi:uncharacterized protein YjbJ (UPF0337 family)
MDENRFEGTARNVGGKVQEGIGRVTGDARTQAEGVMNQAAGAAQDLYGQTADVARQTATTLDDSLKVLDPKRPIREADIAEWSRVAIFAAIRCASSRHRFRAAKTRVSATVR